MSTLATKRGNPVTSVAIVCISDPESIRVKFRPETNPNPKASAH